MASEEQKENKEFLQGAKKIGKLTERDVLHGFYNTNLKLLIDIKIMVRIYENRPPDEPGGKKQVGEQVGPDGSMQPVMTEMTNKEMLDQNQEQYSKQNLLVQTIEALLNEVDEVEASKK